MPRDLFVQPLFSPKLIRSRFPAQALAPAQAQVIREWANALKGSLGRDKEESVRPAFLQKFFVDLLGYQLMGGAVWTLIHEKSAATGSADAALGVFSATERQVVAPFELKGPKTHNLDAIMAGRHKSPVQQAWEYANDLPGSQFVLVSNCDEIRLYALGYGRATYETWRVAELLDPARYASFVGLLHADRLLSGQTQALLKDSALQEREITQALYNDTKTLRQDLMLGLHHLNAQVAFADLVRHAQKLIDRLLFIAFAESRQLLPKGSIAHAANHIDPYNPQDKWRNFCALFKAVDQGNPYLKIPPYNGGLFAADAALDALKVSDKLVARFTALSGYDYAEEVSVTVLGRIFEQSISDLERLHSAGDMSALALSAQSITAKPEAKTKTKAKVKTSQTRVDGKRKRDGVVYTPDHITRFIVAQTLQPVIVERFLRRQRDYCIDSVWRTPSKPERLTAPKTIAADDVTEYHFWLAWQADLTALRVCDPACGSGAFLVAAFDVLKEAYTQLHLRLRELAPQELFNIDISHEILRNNLFGVDINAESIEITKLSLWLKTAEHGHQLAGLEANFYQGNSLVDDPAVDALAFDWAGRMGQGAGGGGGFDVILGNPPYVRQELFSAFKPYLQSHYSSYHGVADLYVYFYELGLRLLRDGGRLGFISSSSFFKSSSGEPLRRLLRTQCQIEVLVDFGDWQVFEGVTTYPAIVVAYRGTMGDARPAQFLQLKTAVPDLSAHFADHQQGLSLEQLGTASNGGDGRDGRDGRDEHIGEWQLEGRQAAALRERLTQGHPSLRDAVGAPLYGLKTGLNQAFVIDRAKRDQLVYADIASEALFKPFLEGKDIKRWRVESEDRWLIVLPKGWTRAAMQQAQGADEATAWAWFAQRHPHLTAYLAPFAQAARKRTDQGEYWWELRACDYYGQFARQKFFWPEFSDAPNYAVDATGLYSTNKGFFVTCDHPHYLVAMLNSKVLWFVIKGTTSIIRGGFQQLRAQNVQCLPIPFAAPEAKFELATLAESAQQTAAQRLSVQRDFTRRILDLLPSTPPKGAQTTLGDKLSQWWLLADFKSFSAEVSKRFKTDIALRERNDWEALFTQSRSQVQQLSANLGAVERSIDQAVYALFGLDKRDIALIEQAVGR